MSLFSKKQDIFTIEELESKINPDEDPFLRNIDQVISTVTKTFIFKLPIFIQLFIRQSKQLFSRFNAVQGIDGSNIFNSLNQISQKQTNLLISDEDLNGIYAHLLSVAKPTLLRAIPSSISTDEDRVFEIVKWLFIPMRINTKTIPIDEKHNLLKAWFSTVFTLPLNSDYLNYYSKLYPNIVKSAIAFQRGVINKDFEPNMQVIEKLVSLSGDTIDAALSTIRKSNNSTFVLIRAYVVIFLITSNDVLRKLCPNINSCKAICPSYDGAWLAPLDTLVSAQLSTLSKSIERME